MNLSPGLVAMLVEAGIDALHWTQVGNPAADDRSILEYARGHDLVLLTNDLDFGAILAASGEASPSVVQIRIQDLRPQSVAPIFIRILNIYAQELFQGSLITLGPRGERIRKLPLREGGNT